MKIDCCPQIFSRISIKWVSPRIPIEEILAGRGGLLKKRVTVSNTLKPRTKAPIVRGRTTPTDDDERAYGGTQGSN